MRCLFVHTVVLVLGSLLGAPAATYACSCPSGPGGSVLWPQDGASGVATDTPIVVARVYQAGNPEEIGISLEAVTGAKLELQEIRRVPPSWQGCGSAEWVFLRPARELDPGMSYTVSFNLPPDSKQQTGSHFTVG